MRVGIYKDKEHKDICVAFYRGVYSVLYHLDICGDVTAEKLLKIVNKGFSNNDLISTKPEEFYEKKEHICDMEIHK